MKNLLAKLGITDRKSAQAVFMQVFKFGCVGLLNAVFSLLIYNVVVFLNPALYIVGNVLAWLVTVCISYLLNRRFVFSDTDEIFLKGLLKCYMAYLASLVVSSLLLFVWVELAKMDKSLAQLINIILMVPMNYLINRFWTFTKK